MLSNSVINETTENEQNKICSPELICDNCDFYPVIPIHGHFECPRCHMPTKCCEGMD